MAIAKNNESNDEFNHARGEMIRPEPARLFQEQNTNNGNNRGGDEEFEAGASLSRQFQTRSAPQQSNAQQARQGEDGREAGTRIADSRVGVVGLVGRLFRAVRTSLEASRTLLQEPNAGVVGGQEEVGRVAGGRVAGGRAGDYGVRQQAQEEEQKDDILRQLEEVSIKLQKVIEQQKAIERKKDILRKERAVPIYYESEEARKKSDNSRAEAKFPGEYEEMKAGIRERRERLERLARGEKTPTPATPNREEQAPNPGTSLTRASSDEDLSKIALLGVGMSPFTSPIQSPGSPR